MKFKVYEVKRVRDDGKDEYKLKFWYLDYADAVAKFKQLVKEEEKVDWIEEGLKYDDERYTVIKGIDFWGFYVDDFLDNMKSEVLIKEREVF